MPIFRNSMEQANRTMSLIIPLMMQRKKDQEELSRKDALIRIEEDKLKAEAAERAQKFKEKADETKTKYLMDMYKEGVKGGDEGLARQFGTQLQAQGFPVATERLPGPQEASGGMPLRFLVSPQKEGMSEADLTKRALSGDKTAQSILSAMQQRKIGVAKAGAQGKIEGLLESMDLDATAQAVIEGRETIENVKNTFGVPIQEAVRTKVLEKDKDFNFLLPRSAYKSLAGSLTNQEKQRGMMGSFVSNLQKQLNRVDEIGEKLTRVDPRIVNVPIRAWKTRIAGSGQEKAFESYLLEISNEIAKLSTGSSASIRELSTDAQERWAKIHDPNLSLKDLKIILAETGKMAQMRLKSTQDEIDFTKSRIKNLAGDRSSTVSPTETQETKSEAPQQAIEFLKKNPKFKDQFKQKYGYLPEGF